MLFMWLSRQTSFSNLIKPWCENTNFKKIQKNLIFTLLPENNSPPPLGRGIVFGRVRSSFLSFFLSCEQHYEKTAGPICVKFSGKVWCDHGTTWLNFGSIRVNGSRSAGQRSICLLSLVIAQRTGVNKSVSFTRWQQGVGFVVPRTTACLIFLKVIFSNFAGMSSWPRLAICCNVQTALGETGIPWYQ